MRMKRKKRKMKAQSLKPNQKEVSLNLSYIPDKLLPLKLKKTEAESNQEEEQCYLTLWIITNRTIRIKTKALLPSTPGFLNNNVKIEFSGDS
jgi:hypothetical protein